MKTSVEVCLAAVCGLLDPNKAFAGAGIQVLHRIRMLPCEVGEVSQRMKH